MSLCRTAVEQVHQAAWQHLRTPAFVSRSLVRAPRGSRLAVTTHQRAVRFLIETRSMDLLIFDEAHHPNQPAIANFSTCARHAQCIGLSASPWSPGCVRAFPMRFIYPIFRALQDGSLLPPCLHEELPTLPPAPRTLHFVESVAAAQRAAPELGALHFVQGDPLTKLGPWLQGRVPDLLACCRLCEGYDVPECARVVIHRHSQSPIWTYQAVGRSLRRNSKRPRPPKPRTQGRGRSLASLATDLRSNRGSQRSQSPKWTQTRTQLAGTHRSRMRRRRARKPQRPRSPERGRTQRPRRARKG